KEYKENEQAEIRKKSLGLSPRDADAVAEAVPGVERVARKVILQTYKVLSPTGRGKPRVLGVSADYGGMMNLSLEEGRFLDSDDEERFAQVCVVGPGIRRDLFGFEAAIGKALKVNEQWLTVVGILAPSGVGVSQNFQGVKLTGTANDIYLPATTAARKFQAEPLKSPLDELIVEMKKDASVREAAAVLDPL